MNSCKTDRFLATTIICSLSTLNYIGELLHVKKKVKKKGKEKADSSKRNKPQFRTKKKVCMGKVAKAEDKKVCTAHREILH